MSDTTYFAPIGSEVELTGGAHEVPTGTRGHVTGYRARRPTFPIQVTFDDEGRTTRSYTRQQFGWLSWPFTPSGLISWPSLRKSARIYPWME